MRIVLLLVALVPVLSGCPQKRPSTDRWEPYDTGLQTVSIHGLAVHPHDLERITVATSNGVQVTDDGGRTWRSGNTGLPAPRRVAWNHIVSNSMWRHESEGDDALLAQFDGRLYTSTDFGRSWTPASGTCPSCTSVWYPAGGRCIDVLAGATRDPSGSGRLYAGTIVAGAQGGVFASGPRTLSWDWHAP